MYKVILIVISTVLIVACNNNGHEFDATGNFEADEVLVSPEIGGKILDFRVEEGQQIPRDSLIAVIDGRYLELQVEQAEASLDALNERTVHVEPQVALLQQQAEVQKTRMDYLVNEKQRLQRLYEKDAATGKQVDDMQAQIDQLQQEMLVIARQIKVQQDQAATQNRTVLSEQKPLARRVDLLNDQLSRTKVINPISGTVIAKYAEAGEVVAAGKPLYKIADLSNLILRAYITGDQLPSARLGEKVKVWIDNGDKGYRELSGTIQWISDKAEFTPKTIQTRNERANLVYAIKVKVKNDGSLKLGMYGEMSFSYPKEK